MTSVMTIEKQATQNFDALNNSEVSELAQLNYQNLTRPTLPKKHRLLTPKQFQFVFANAKKFSNRHWTLIVRPNQENFPRIGLAIAKKQLIRAVWRNRVKRLAREAFAQHKQALNGYDIVVLGRKEMKNIANSALKNSFEHLIRKISASGLKNTKKSRDIN